MTRTKSSFQISARLRTLLRTLSLSSWLSLSPSLISSTSGNLCLRELFQPVGECLLSLLLPFAGFSFFFTPRICQFWYTIALRTVKISQYGPKLARVSCSLDAKSTPVWKKYTTARGGNRSWYQLSQYQLYFFSHSFSHIVIVVPLSAKQDLL